MNLEQQVCSLDLAKRLKELGVKQESLHFWRIACGRGGSSEYGFLTDDTNEPNACGCLNFSAFTVAELGEIILSQYGALVEIAKGKMFGGKGFSIPEDDEAFFRWMIDANSWAKMLVYLIENKLITV